MGEGGILEGALGTLKVRGGRDTLLTGGDTNSKQDLHPSSFLPPHFKIIVSLLLKTIYKTYHVLLGQLNLLQFIQFTT